MNKTYRLSLILLLVGLASGPLPALTPKEVLVVANENSKDSIELARFYMEARKIPADNLVLIKTTAEYEVKRADFETQIRDPIAAALRQRKLDSSIKCVCLIWGVPVRIGLEKSYTPRPMTPTTASSQPASAASPIEEVYREAIKKACAHLAIDVHFLPSVCKSFKAPTTQELLPVAKVFGEDEYVPKQLDDPDQAVKDLIGELAAKQTELSKLKDATQQQAAHRQLMAIHLDAIGLKGLRDYIKDYSPSGAPKIEDVEKRIAQAQQRLDALSGSAITPESAKVRAALLEIIGGQTLVIMTLAESKLPTLPTPPTPSLVGKKIMDTAVDSELTTVLWTPQEIDHLRVAAAATKPPEQSLPNLLMWRYRAGRGYPPMLMTARIDGPCKNDALRALKDALAAEKAGLKGTVYIDAGVTTVGGNKSPVYAQYDQKLKKLYSFLTANTKLKVVLDEKEEVFAPGTCPDAALYIGWYSLQKYVPAFKWVPGAVGWHIASFDAIHLRDPDSNEWCPKMIHEGTAATLGAVNEPFLSAFPEPQEFFPLLLTGKYTLAECYWRTLPLVNWRITLIGDPLYNPFAANPALSTDVLPSDLAPLELLHPASKPAATEK